MLRVPGYGFERKEESGDPNKKWLRRAIAVYVGMMCNFAAVTWAKEPTALRPESERGFVVVGNLSRMSLQGEDPGTQRWAPGFGIGGRLRGNAFPYFDLQVEALYVQRGLREELISEEEIKTPGRRGQFHYLQVPLLLRLDFLSGARFGGWGFFGVQASYMVASTVREPASRLGNLEAVKWHPLDVGLVVGGGVAYAREGVRGVVTLDFRFDRSLPVFNVEDKSALSPQFSVFSVMVGVQYPMNFRR